MALIALRKFRNLKNRSNPFEYWFSRRFLLDDIHPHFSTSARLAAPMRWRSLSSLLRSGPSPMMAKFTFDGNFARISLRSPKRCSAPRRPTHPMIGPSRPPLRRLRISSLLKLGLNATVSTPLSQTCKFLHPSPLNSFSRMLEVTNVVDA